MTNQTDNNQDITENNHTPQRPPIEIIDEGVTASFQKPPTKKAKKTVEVTRLVLAITFGLAYVGLIFVLLGHYLSRNEGLSIEDVKELAAVLLVPLGALVATVLGFYFASQAD